MQLDDLPRIPTAGDDVVVELVPSRRGGEPRTGELGDGREEETVQRQDEDVCQRRQNGAEDQRPRPELEDRVE